MLNVNAKIIMNKYDPEEIERKIAELKGRQEFLRAKRKIEMEREKKRATFDLLFPEFKGVPVVWLLIGLGCALFGLFTLII